MTACKIIFIATALFATAVAEAADAKAKATSQELVSLGAYFGSLAQFQPNAKVLAIYADGDVSIMSLQTLEAQKRNPEHYIYKTRHEQIVRLLELAQKLAIKYNAPAYALANLRVNTNVNSDGIIVETWGDLLAVQPLP